MKDGCESYRIVANYVQSEIDASSSFQTDVGVSQTETDLSGVLDALRHRYADMFEPPADLLG